MFKIYKQTIRIGSKEQPPQIEYQVEENGRSSISKILAIPAMMAGAVVGTLVFSVFFAVLLIPLGIVGFRAWRLIRTEQRSNNLFDKLRVKASLLNTPLFLIKISSKTIAIFKKLFRKQLRPQLESSYCCLKQRS